MNTFLPYKSLEKSAKCLDNKRLGKQRVETLQIYNALQRLKKTPNKKFGWKNHPCVRMWENHENLLLKYGIAVCEEWKRRGFQDTLQKRFRTDLKKHRETKPEFLGNKKFHKAMKSNLYRKDKNYYRQFSKIGSKLPYVWG